MKPILLPLILLSLFFSCHKDKILVKSMENAYYNDSNEFLTEACKEWKLDKKGVENFFVNSRVISSHEKKYFYYTLPCEIKGELLYNDS